MKLIVITLRNCPKCREAYRLFTLAEYDKILPIEWLDATTERAAKLILEYGFTHAPSFLFQEGDFVLATDKLLMVKKKLEEIQNRQE